MVGVVGGASGSGDSQVTVCIELATGNLQRNLTLIAETIDSPTVTGKWMCFNKLFSDVAILSY